MTIQSIRKQLHDFIDQADNRKIKAMYTMLENELDKTEALLNTREMELENGTVAGVPWEEVKQKVTEALVKVNNQ